MKKLTLEQKKKAVQIAIDGGDPEAYLRECGSKDPRQMWNIIRANLRKADPERFLQLPKPKVGTTKEEKEEKPAEDDKEDDQAEDDRKDSPAEDYVEYPKEDDPEEMPAKLIAKVDGPVEYEPIMKRHTEGPRPLEILGMTVTGVGGKTGFFQLHDTRGGRYISFDTQDGDNLYMSIRDWKDFMKELKRAAGIFGIDLDAEE